MKMKQEYVAERVGIDAKSLSRIEGGTHYPSLDTLVRFGDVLEVPLKELFEFPEALRQYLHDAAESVGEAQLQQAVGAMRTALNKAQQTTTKNTQTN